MKVSLIRFKWFTDRRRAMAFAVPLFSGLVACAIVVPFVPHETWLLPRMNLTDLPHMFSQVPRVVLFAHDVNVQSSHIARRMLQRAAPLFSDMATFAEIEAFEAHHLLSELVSAPRLLFYGNASLLAHCAFPASEAPLLDLLHHVISLADARPVMTWDDFYRSIGSFPVTLLYPSNQLSAARSIHGELSARIWPVGLAPFATRAAGDLGLRLDKFYVFRAEDLFLEELDANLSDFLNSTRPVFKKLTQRDFTGPDLIFGVASDTLTKEVAEILSFVGENFPKYSAAFIPPPLHPVANLSVGGSLRQLPSIALFNPSGRSYIPLPSELHLGSESIIVDLENFLRCPPDFVKVSEPAPISQTGPYVKLVGTTHDAFVADDSVDSVVMYFAARAPRYFDAFSNAADRATNVTTIRFGAINVTANAGNFPAVSAVPVIRIFPAARKEEQRSFFGRADPDAILRFVEADRKGIEVREESERDRRFETMQIWMAKNGLDLDERKKANDRLAEIQAAMTA